MGNRGDSPIILSGGCWKTQGGERGQVREGTGGARGERFVQGIVTTGQFVR